MVFTTAEVVIGECESATFTRWSDIVILNIFTLPILPREHDTATGFDELKVEARRS